MDVMRKDIEAIGNMIVTRLSFAVTGIVSVVSVAAGLIFRFI